MKDLKIYIIIGSILLGIYLVAQYNKPKPVNWAETFSRKDKIPFGTYILFNQLNDIFPGARVEPFRQIPATTLRDNIWRPGSYIIIARSADIGTFDFEELEKYMRKGNDVFVASYYMGTYINDSLKTKINSELQTGGKNKTAVSFVNSRLKPEKEYRFDRDIGNQYFSSFDTSKVVILGKNSRGHANFIKYNYGKGNLYLIASPYFFTNYNLLKPDGADYAAKALSYVRTSKDVIWDDFSALGSAESESPARVFLEHDSLRYAYYLALFSLVLFVIYEVKRRQRIIPVIEPLKNSTTEFVSVVGQLYYQKRDNSNIAAKKVTYLLEEIRSRYNIKTQTINKEFAEMLIKKSGADQHLVGELVRHIHQIQKYTHVSDQELIELNNNIELFHKQSR